MLFSKGRAGVPMEVMGLMLGEFVDDYTVRVIDVFAMPQSGTVGCISILGLFPSIKLCKYVLFLPYLLHLMFGNICIAFLSFFGVTVWGWRMLYSRLICYPC